MDILKHSALQAQWGLHYMVQSLRWDDILVNDIITTLDAHQLASGFVANIMMIPQIQINYLNVGWLPHLRAILTVLGEWISIENAWSPCLQRMGDDSLMEIIAACTTLTTIEKRSANET